MGVETEFTVKTSSSALIIERSIPVTDTMEKCELLAKHFAGVFSDNFDVMEDTESFTTRNLSNFLIFPHEIIHVSKNLKNSCSLTSDGLPQILFKKCIVELSTPLAHIFNYSMQLGQVPSVWKQAIITAIPKVKNASTPKEFRPISLLPIPSKLMEKVIKMKMDAHIERYNILPDTQYGFRSKSSINDLMIKCVTDWSHSLSRGLNIDVVYADISKTFDKVNHKKVISQLKRIGIGGQLLKWLTSYFCDRKFCVKLDGSISEYYPAPSGVPQGAVLSPLLFNIYIRDILTWKPLPRNVRVY